MYTMMRVLLFAFLLTAGVYPAHADDDHERALQLLKEGKILSLEDIISRLPDKNKWRIIEVELEEEDGRIVYELELLGDDGRVREVKLDAKTGQLISTEDN